MPTLNNNINPYTHYMRSSAALNLDLINTDNIELVGTINNTSCLLSSHDRNINRILQFAERPLTSDIPVRYTDGCDINPDIGDPPAPSPTDSPTNWEEYLKRWFDGFFIRSLNYLLIVQPEESALGRFGESLIGRAIETYLLRNPIFRSANLNRPDLNVRNILHQRSDQLFFWIKTQTYYLVDCETNQPIMDRIVYLPKINCPLI